MNGNPIVVGHTRLIVSVIGVLSAGALALGAWLIVRGYQTGELLIQTGGSGVTGLLGFLGGKAMGMAMQPPPDITVTGNPPRVEVAQPTEKKETP